MTRNEENSKKGFVCFPRRTDRAIERTVYLSPCIHAYNILAPLIFTPQSPSFPLLYLSHMTMTHRSLISPAQKWDPSKGRPRSLQALTVIPKPNQWNLMEIIVKSTLAPAPAPASALACKFANSDNGLQTPQD